MTVFTPGARDRLVTTLIDRARADGRISAGPSRAGVEVLLAETAHVDAALARALTGPLRAMLG